MDATSEFISHTDEEEISGGDKNKEARGTGRQQGPGRKQGPKQEALSANMQDRAGEGRAEFRKIPPADR